jgi:hypothetical protein
MATWNRGSNFLWVTIVCLQVSDLGAVLHMVGGTAASFMIFFLPGMMLINAAIVKRSNEVSLSTAPIHFHNQYTNPSLTP